MFFSRSKSVVSRPRFASTRRSSPPLHRRNAAWTCGCQTSATLTPWFATSRFTSGLSARPRQARVKFARREGDRLLGEAFVATDTVEQTLPPRRHEDDGVAASRREAVVTRHARQAELSRRVADRRREHHLVLVACRRREQVEVDRLPRAPAAVGAVHHAVRHESPLDVDEVAEEPLVATERIEGGGVGVARNDDRAAEHLDSMPERRIGDDVAAGLQPRMIGARTRDAEEKTRYADRRTRHGMPEEKLGVVAAAFDTVEEDVGRRRLGAGAHGVRQHPQRRLAKPKAESQPEEIFALAPGSLPGCDRHDLEAGRFAAEGEAGEDAMAAPSVRREAGMGTIADRQSGEPPALLPRKFQERASAWDSRREADMAVRVIAEEQHRAIERRIRHEFQWIAVHRCHEPPRARPEGASLDQHVIAGVNEENLHLGQDEAVLLKLACRQGAGTVFQLAEQDPDHRVHETRGANALAVDAGEDLADPGEVGGPPDRIPECVAELCGFRLPLIVIEQARLDERRHPPQSPNALPDDCLVPPRQLLEIFRRVVEPVDQRGTVAARPLEEPRRPDDAVARALQEQAKHGQGIFAVAYVLVERPLGKRAPPDEGRGGVAQDRIRLGGEVDERSSPGGT